MKEAVKVASDKVAWGELPRSIPVKELCPPVVYFHNPDCRAHISGLFGPEMKAFTRLMPELEKNKVMSESEITKFIKKELPDISESRVEILLGRLSSEGGLAGKEVSIRKEDLEEYLKRLTPHMRKIDRYSMKLRAHGLDPQLVVILSRYDFRMLGPILDNTKDVNILFHNQQVRLRNMGIPGNTVQEYCKFGVFPDDIEKFGGKIVGELTKFYKRGWREQLERLEELRREYGFEWREHISVCSASKTFLRENLEACRKMEIDPEKMRLVGRMGEPKEVFEKETKERFKEFNLRVCKKRSIDPEEKEVAKLLELPPKRFERELEKYS